ncbi:MAG: hypothetical protein GTO55_07450, partial [Armatimonadetes bacterium]|nr:hypothetical protein [Armatimonadota bacterium]NIO56800.1 hypothetical protein [Candidatus Latescibacterota bacterium]NIM24104.1 hypothetical protein [Armatimonadota bacterium]NIM67959.1 hypothetical protein [Armatimonadota bacterium]NIM76480.1 hypothetical protein [Armatimonadota bacterium]
MDDKRVESQESRVESPEQTGSKSAAPTLHSQLSTHNAVLLAFIDLRHPKPLEQAAQGLRVELPDSQIICLNTPETKTIESKVSGVDRWLTYGVDATGAFDLIDKIRDLQPAAVCILYRTAKAKAHLRLELIAALTGLRVPLFGAFANAYTKPRRMSRLALHARIKMKILLMFARSTIAAILAAIVGGVLFATCLLARPGERLGAPA